MELSSKHHPGLIDATRISDNRLVYIKQVDTGGEEARIATMLVSDGLINDPRNHSVPILDIFKDEEDDTISYMVMPFLRLIHNPDFETVDDVVRFVDQILEVCSISLTWDTR